MVVSIIAAEILQSLGAEATVPDDGTPDWAPEDLEI